MMISIQFRSGGGSAIASGDDGNSTGQTVPLCTHFGTCTTAGRFDDLYFFLTLSLLLLWLECRWGTECCLGTEERTSVHFASAAYVWLSSFAFFFACWLCMFTLCFFLIFLICILTSAIHTFYPVSLSFPSEKSAHVTTIWLIFTARQSNVGDNCLSECVCLFVHAWEYFKWCGRMVKNEMQKIIG